MKKKQAFLLTLAGVLLVLVLTGCGPKGGTVILENHSSLSLASCYISFGNSNADSLAPGQWMKASIDKNAPVEVHFHVANDADKDSLEVNQNGSWINWVARKRWYCNGNVNDGDTLIVTVTNK